MANESCDPAPAQSEPVKPGTRMVMCVKFGKEMPGLDRDYPDRTQKPVDTSYLPYADAFPAEQHHLGPFQPIEAYYKNKKQSK